MHSDALNVAFQPSKFEPLRLHRRTLNYRSFVNDVKSLRSNVIKYSPNAVDYGAVALIQRNR